MKIVAFDLPGMTFSRLSAWLSNSSGAGVLVIDDELDLHVRGDADFGRREAVVANRQCEFGLAGRRTRCRPPAGRAIVMKRVIIIVLRSNGNADDNHSHLHSASKTNDVSKRTLRPGNAVQARGPVNAAETAGPARSISCRHRSVALLVVALERDAARLRGPGQADQAELPLADERAGHEVRIRPLGAVGIFPGARRQRARRELVERIRAGALDAQQLGEMPIAGREHHAVDALREQPVGERLLLVRVSD